MLSPQHYTSCRLGWTVAQLKLWLSSAIGRLRSEAPLLVKPAKISRMLSGSLCRASTSLQSHFHAQWHSHQCHNGWQSPQQWWEEAIKGQKDGSASAPRSSPPISRKAINILPLAFHVQPLHSRNPLFQSPHPSGVEKLICKPHSCFFIPWPLHTACSAQHLLLVSWIRSMTPNRKSSHLLRLPSLLATDTVSEKRGWATATVWIWIFGHITPHVKTRSPLLEAEPNGRFLGPGSKCLMNGLVLSLP